MTQRLRRCIDIVRDLIGERGQIRAYLVQPIDNVFARVVHGAMNESDADDALIMRRDGANQALCIARREPVLLLDADFHETERRSPTNKYIHALRPAEITHAYCIPMFDGQDEWSKTDPAQRAEPLAAFCLDFVGADQRLLLDPDTEDALAAIADALVDCWKQRERAPPGRWSASDEPAAGDWSPIRGITGFYVSSRKVRMPSPERLWARIEDATA